MSCSVNIAAIKWRWSGGFYFRFIPYQIFRLGINKILHDKEAYIFYIHPWEFDPNQPKVRNISLQYKFRHYTNLKETEKKFIQLLSDYRFLPIRTGLPE